MDIKHQKWYYKKNKRWWNEDAIWVQILKKYLLNYDSNPIEKISTSIYNDFIYNFNNIEYLKQCAVVVLKYKTIDGINKYILSLVSGELKSYYSYDNEGTTDELNVLYPQEFLHTLNFNDVPPHELHLKVSILIMSLRNLNQ